MKLLHVLCVLCGLLAPASALDREAFTFTKYDLNVRIEPAQQRLAVRGQITLRNDSNGPQKNVSLQISSTLDWRSIKLGGKAVHFVSQPYTSDIDHTGVLSEAIITLPQEIPPKGKVELDIGYEGVIPLDATRLTRIGVPEELARHNDWDQIGASSTAIRGIGYVAWYPVGLRSANLSEGNNLFETLGRWKTREAASTMQIHFGVVGDSAGSSSELIVNAEACKPASADNGHGQNALIDCSFEPLGATVQAFAIATYSVLNPSTLDVHYFPEHKPAAENYELATQLAMPFVKEWFRVYRSKAMYVWWMLRDMIGEETLKKALALYRPDQDKEASYLQRLIEAQSKRELEWFFDDWVYRDRGLPDFRVESAYPRQLLGGGYVVTITIENLGEAGAQVPVTLLMEGGQVTRLVEVHSKSKSVMRIQAAGTPQEIVVNDGSVPESDMTNNIFKIKPNAN